MIPFCFSHQILFRIIKVLTVYFELAFKKNLVLLMCLIFDQIINFNQSLFFVFSFWFIDRLISLIGSVFLILTLIFSISKSRFLENLIDEEVKLIQWWVSCEAYRKIRHQIDMEIAMFMCLCCLKYLPVYLSEFYFIFQADDGAQD